MSAGAQTAAAGLIGRSVARADAELATDPAEREAALASGAQIVSTDYPPSEPQQGTAYLVEFPDGALARAVP